MEQRKEKRFAEQDEVVIKYVSSPKEAKAAETIKATTLDISLAGARILAKRSFSPGTILRVKVDLKKSGQVLNIDAEVKWCQQKADNETFEMGVEFLHNISQTLLLLLKHLYMGRNGIPSEID